MRTDDFAFDLPEASIAQRPAPRGTSRLLALDQPAGQRHRSVSDLPSLLRAGDLLVVNDTRVIPARLRGRRLPGGGAAEILLLEPSTHGENAWDVLLRPAKRLRPGTRLRFGDDHGPALGAVVSERGEEGRGTVRFDTDPRHHLEAIGQVPLPPYIRRQDDRADRHDYQTVFAAEPGAVAAPTAGLHFTPDLLERLEARGVTRASVTLHVGIGTFRPVAVDVIEGHRMESERFDVPPATAEAITETRARGGRVVAVGTTVVRTLETAAMAASDDQVVAPGPGRSELFIRPGFRFRAVDVLMTNFHLPRSTLLMLVSAFAGRERVLAAYREAVTLGYRFFSYGDAMLLERVDVES